jgi:hypothetical protein
MASLSELFITCSNYKEIPAAYNKINPSLPREIKDRMNEIMVNYMTRFGPKGVFERFNNRSIAQILAEYEPGEIEVLDSGEMDGLKYKVTRAKREQQGSKDPGI